MHDSFQWIYATAVRVLMFINLACSEKDIFVTGRQLADAHKQEEEKLLKQASDTSIMKVNTMHTYIHLACQLKDSILMNDL